MRPIILASQSPRRRQLLAAMGVSFDVVVSNFDEQFDHNRPSEDVAVELGLGKALAVAGRHPEAIVIGSDCIVELDGMQLGKYSDIDEAVGLFKRYARQPVKVVSSIAVVCRELGYQKTGFETCFVHFKPFDEQAVRAYLKSGDYLDKAGAFGVQSGAGPLIERIEGDSSAVIGLPTVLLGGFLHELHIAAQPVRITDWRSWPDSGPAS